MKSLEELQSVHPNWKSHAEQATYLYRSFIGGNTYRSGKYLTRYIGEDSAPGDAYGNRLLATPLDNHVASTVDIYRSFLFREPPTRQLGLLVTNPLVNEWMDDTDQEGQSIDSFLKTANDLAMVMGNVWLLVDKPTYKVDTQAEEIALGLRAYAAMYTPQNVLDWHYERNIAGKMVLKYIKVRESENQHEVIYTCWHEDSVEKYTVAKDEMGDATDILDYQIYDNPLGKVPFINHAPVRSPVKGVGYSMLQDVADAQRYIYNLASEAEQAIRISSHPTLVKTPSADATAGAGAIVTIQEDMDPQLKPYLLSPSGATISSILSTMQNTVESIMRSTHTSAVQGLKTAQSGVALQTERQLLNAKLSDLADTLNETEYAMWDLWFRWQGIETPEEFELKYNDSFDIRDKYSELDLIIKAKAAGFANPTYIDALNKQLASLMIDDNETVNLLMNEMEGEPEFRPHMMYDPNTGNSEEAKTPEDHQRLEAQGYVHLENMN
jgi:hypothetical protein